MAIYKPVPELNDRRKRLIYLLSKMLDEALRQDQGCNHPDGVTFLSRQEKEEIVGLLEELQHDRHFFAGLNFVDSLMGMQAADERQLRELFLSERRRLGKTRALASKQWADFLARIGRKSSWSRWGAVVRPLKFPYFLNMERKLFNSIHISPWISDYLVEQIIKYSDEIKLIIEGGSLKDIEYPYKIRDLFKSILADIDNNYRNIGIKRSQISSMIILISNLSVIFTTRDWSAAGTISAVSGALVGVFPDAER